jgi:hypothetical protein
MRKRRAVRVLRETHVVANKYDALGSRLPREVDDLIAAVAACTQGVRIWREARDDAVSILRLLARASTGVPQHVDALVEDGAARVLYRELRARVPLELFFFLVPRPPLEVGEVDDVCCGAEEVGVVDGDDAASAGGVSGVEDVEGGSLTKLVDAGASGDEDDAFSGPCGLDDAEPIEGPLIGASEDFFGSATFSAATCASSAYRRISMQLCL